MTSDWDRSLFNCSSCGWCWFGAFCPCFAVFSILKDTYGKEGGDNPLKGHNPIECCIGSAICFCCLPTAFLTLTRMSVRTEYDIEGGCCTDCLVSHICCPCALAQEHFEAHK
jgi:Cys-rich protein (TIGR01571 family)